MSNVLDKVTRAIEKLISPRDKYADMVFVLRNIRESYQITQKEIALILKVTQSTISKFEALSMIVSLEFLISYASVLGYSITVDSVSETDDISRFNTQQAQISKEITAYDSEYIKNIYLQPFPRIPEISKTVVSEKSRP